MSRDRTFALIALASLVLLPAAPARAGLLPDIRGLSFDEPFQAVQFLAGNVSGFGFVTDPLTNPTSVQSFDPIPHTFDVEADPAVPNDPMRIQVETRLFTDTTPGDPLVYIPLTLTGTYDRTTGDISLSGGSTGTFLNDRGPDPFGLFPGTYLYEQLTDPMESLHGVVSVGGGGITITGTDPAVTPGNPGNITFASASLLWIPAGSTNPNDAVYSASVSDPTGATYNWTATAVPEPSTAAMLACGALVGTVVLSRRPR